MPSLRELQSDFLEAILGGSASLIAAERLRGELVSGAFDIAERLAVYANNAEHHYLESLRKSFPAVRRLVGEAYFAQCAREFRRAEPSRSGDLQQLGARFPVYWQDRHAGDGYRYLADIARLEWLYQEASTAAEHAPFDFAKLARVPQSAYDALRFCLHPSVRLYTSEFPALAIWEANLRSAQEPEIIDLAGGGDRLVLVRRHEGIAPHPLTTGEFVFLRQIERSEGFADCVAAAEESDADFDASSALEKFVREQVIVDLLECP